MWDYPQLDPVAISLGPVSIRWYAVSYLLGIALVWWTVLLRIRRHQLNWTREQLSDLLFYCVLGMIVGGRVGYLLFYGFDNLIRDPVSIVRVWEGGMSFHGGFIGVMIAAWIYGSGHRRTFFGIMDMIAPSIPLALGAGRLGNFINGELPGRVTEVGWAVISPGALVGRHPSSLYQATLEGPVLFLFLWWFAREKREPMAVSGAFLIGYGALRIFSEFFREPDGHLGYILFDRITAGQLLSLPMVVIGVAFFFIIHQRKSRTSSISDRWSP